MPPSTPIRLAGVAEMTGGVFQAHPWELSGARDRRRPHFPRYAALPGRAFFFTTRCIRAQDTGSRDKVNVLMRLDETQSITPTRNTASGHGAPTRTRPLLVEDVRQGPRLLFQLGHTKEAWENPTFRDVSRSCQVGDERTEGSTAPHPKVN